jgi:hypothetical protein
MRNITNDCFPSNNISPQDRRLLVKASLGLFLRRMNHGVPVHADDLIRLAAFADDKPTASSGELG